MSTLAIALLLALAGSVPAGELEPYDESREAFDAALAFVNDAFVDAPMFSHLTYLAYLEIVRHNPELEQHAEVFHEFYREHMPRAEWRNHLAHAFAGEFSADELRAMREFYSTPTGQRALATSPGFLARALDWITLNAVDNRDRILGRESDADEQHRER